MLNTAAVFNVIGSKPVELLIMGNSGSTKRFIHEVECVAAVISRSRCHILKEFISLKKYNIMKILLVN